MAKRAFRIFTVRMDPEMYDDLALVAEAEGVTISEAWREAVTQWLDKKYRGKATLRKIDAAIARRAALLNRRRSSG
jgi:Arc/MetJ-type ribon-helix-helix transcriptional regulator